MLIYSQDRKSVVDARLLQVQRSFAGGKDAKFCIMAIGESTGAVIAANYPEEKLAIDALEKAYEAFTNGASLYKFD